MELEVFSADANVCRWEDECPCCPVRCLECEYYQAMGAVEAGETPCPHS